MENEIMVNEEVVTDVVDVAAEETGKGLKIAVGIGLAALVGVVAYKVGKKVVAKIKTKKALKAAAEGEEYPEHEENCEINSAEEI